MNEQSTRIRRARHGKKNPYFMMLRDTAQDLELSAEALGILTYLLSKPDTWDTQIGDLQKRKGVGRDRARRIVNELIEARYMKREKVRNDDGTFDYVIEVYEIPHNQPLETSDGNPVTGIQSPETRPIDNKGIDIKEKEKGSPSPFKIYERNIGVLTPMISEQIKSAVSDYPDGWFSDAVELAVTRNKRSLGYVLGILRKWHTDGKDDGKQPATNGANSASKRHEIDIKDIDLGFTIGETN